MAGSSSYLFSFEQRIKIKQGNCHQNVYGSQLASMLCKTAWLKISKCTVYILWAKLPSNNLYIQYMNIYIYTIYTYTSTIKSIKLYQPNKHLSNCPMFGGDFFLFWEPHCLQVIQGHRRPQCFENGRQRPSGVKRWEKTYVLKMLLM